MARAASLAGTKIVIGTNGATLIVTATAENSAMPPTVVGEDRVRSLAVLAIALALTQEFFIGRSRLEGELGRERIAATAWAKVTSCEPSDNAPGGVQFG